MGNRTFTMVKPTAMHKGFAGPIFEKIATAGFKIVALKMTQLTKDDAKKFYEVHKERPFYKDLVDFMSSGPITAAVLEKENAVADYRKLIGNTNPALAEDGTIRKLYGTDMSQNAVHGSDSDENAEIEISFFFSNREIFEV